MDLLPVPSATRTPALPPGHVLPVGTRLLDYEVTGLIGEGGFGIVYLAWDHSLQRKVAVKEYMPASMVARAAGSSAIVVKSDRHLDTFRAGLKSFVNEARLLARFDHRALVKVYRFWEENGTAYMVMPFYEGPTLKAALAALGHVPDEDEIRGWLMPLLDALAVMHAAQCFHRDIAPDNILLTPTGPLLLDFGAARRVIGDLTHALTVVLKPGYAPIEQYGDVASMAQGPWTDLYALACVVYYAITGHTPTSSVERLMDDRLTPLAASATGAYSAAFLETIDAALAVRPQDRPQNERAFRAMLDADLPVRTVAADSASMPFHDSVPAPFPQTQQALPATVPRTLAPELPTQLMPRPPHAQTSLPPERGAAVAPVQAPVVAPPIAVANSPEHRRSRAPAAIAAALLAVLIAAAAWWSTAGRAPGAPSPSPAAIVVTPSNADPLAGVASAPAVAATPPPTVRASEPAATTVAAPIVVEAAPLVVAPSPAPVPTAVVRPKPVPVTREPKTPSVTSPDYAEPAAPRRASGGRCSDILQKGSLEPLPAEEANYLKRECR